MLVKKVPPRSRPGPTAEIKALIESLTGDDQQVFATLQSLTEYNYPKSDFHDFIPVLNRLDDIMEKLIEKYDLKNLQLVDFEQVDKQMLLYILRFTRLLWENCTSRSIYSSYDRLNLFLKSTDLDLVEATLKFLIKPAQRVPAQRSLKAGLQETVSSLKVLAQIPGIETHKLSTLKLLEDDLLIPDEVLGVSFSFYRSKESASISSSLESLQTPTQTPSKHVQIAPSTPGTNVEGMSLVKISKSAISKESVQSLFKRAVEKYNIPKESQFSLFNSIRFSNSLPDKESRQRLVLQRLLAFSVYSYLISEDEMTSEFLLFEPDLIASLNEIVTSDTFSLQIKALAFGVLECICKYRQKIGEVLQLLGASVSHGILMKTLRHVIVSMDQEPEKFPTDFVEAIYSIVSYLLATQSGATSLMSAGIIQLLITVLNVKNPKHFKMAGKFINVLDNLLYSFNSAFNTFTHSDGLDILVLRIKEELEFLENFRLNSMDEKFPADRTGFLRTMLKFALHMMQSFGTTDRLRNLIDTSLPASLAIIFKNSVAYSGNVYGIAVSIMATFIHNEPTSLSILQENKLPDVFLESVQSKFPVSAEVIAAIPNAFGAICLNENGLESFNRINPLPTYFSIFYDLTSQDALLDSEVAAVIGNSIDEFMRHHPSTKDQVIACIVQVILQVFDLAKNPEYISKECVLLLQDETVKAESPSIIVSMIDTLARFLEGVFQNTMHSKDFCRLNGVQALLKIIKLKCLPAEFSGSQQSYSLNRVFRILMENNHLLAVDLMIQEFASVLQESKSILGTIGTEGILSGLVELNKDNNDRANEIFSHLILVSRFIKIFTDSFQSHNFPSPSTKTIHCILQAFSGLMGKAVLTGLGTIHRLCNWETILFGKHFPAEWFEKTSEKEPKSLDQLTPMQLVRNEFDLSSVESVENLDLTPKISNCRKLKKVNSSISLNLSSLFPVLIKACSSRRINEPDQKASAAEIIEKITRLFVENLEWRPTTDDDKVLFSYFTVNVGCVLMIFSDEREKIYMQTTSVFSFKAAGGIEQLFQIIELCWKRINESADPKSLESKAQTCFNLILSVLVDLCNSKMLFESPNMLSMLERSTNPFDPNTHLVEIRYSTLSFLSKILSDSKFNSQSLQTLKKVIGLLVQIYKADAELRKDTPPARSTMSPTAGTLSAELSNALATLATQISARGIVPSINPVPQPPAPASVNVAQADVDQLMEMGFSRSAATRALQSIEGDVELAADFLLNNPEFDDDEESDDEDDDMEDSEDFEDVQEDLSEMLDAPISPPVDKEIALHEEKLKSLNELRDSLKQSIIDICLNLIEKQQDLVFEVKDLVQQLEKDHVSEFAIGLIKDMDPVKASSRYRLFAMLASDPLVSKSVYSMELIIPVIRNLLKNEFPSSSIASALLIIEGFLSLSEGPVQVECIHQISVAMEMKPQQSPLDVSVKIELVQYAIKYLDNPVEDAQLVHSMFRLLVILTRNEEVTNAFMESNGLSVILKHSLMNTFPNQDTLQVMILRNLNETRQVLRATMQEVIANWFTHPRVRATDLTTFIKANAQYVLREPVLFVSLVKIMCKLQNINGRSPQIALKEDLPPIEQPLESRICTLLCAEIMSLRSLEDEDPAISMKRSYIFYFLQELINSYWSARQSMALQLTRKHKHATPKPFKNNMLSYIINDLILSEADNATGDFKQDLLFRESESASSLLLGIFQSPKKLEKEEEKVAFEGIIKPLVEALMKVIKESPAEKYEKLTSLGDLLRCMPAKSTNSTEVKSIIVRILVENGVVGFLASLLNEVDPYHPKASDSVAEVISTLEYYIVEAQALCKQGKLKLGSSRPASPVMSDHDEMSESEDEEIMQIARNSALNMYNQPTESDVEMDDMSDEDDDIIEEEDIEDEMFEDFDNGDEIESDVEEDMEIMFPAPYHGVSDDIEGEEQSTEEDDLDDSDSEDSESDLESVEDDGAIPESEMWQDVDEEEDDDDEPEDFDEEDDFDDDEDDEEQNMEQVLQNVFNSASGPVHRMQISGNRAVIPIPNIGGGLRTIFRGVESGPVDVEIRLANPNDPLLHHFEATRPVNFDLQHPLLQQGRPAASAPQRRLFSHSDSNPLEQVFGGQSLQFFEQLLSQSMGGNRSVTIDSNGLFDQSQSSRTEKKFDPRIDVMDNFKVLYTAERWLSSAKLIFGSSLNESALKVVNEICNALMPEALEEKAKKDEEEKKEQEKKQKEKEEAQKKIQEWLKDKEPAADQMETEQEHVFVTIHGERIDISGTGIDAAFLEALPDDLRQEVIDQHYREQEEIATIPREIEDAIGRDFLQAVPPALRAELVSQTREMLQQRAAAQEEQPPAVPIVSEKKEKQPAYEYAQLLDRAGIISVLKLLYVPEVLKKDSCHALLSGICNNSKNRADVLALVLAILNEKSLDPLYERKSKSVPNTPRKTSFTPAALPWNTICERSLELLVKLSMNTHVSRFFLTESEHFLTAYCKSLGKKQKASKYPVVIVLNLLQSTEFSSGPLLEQIVYLLSTVFKSLGVLLKKPDAEKYVPVFDQLHIQSIAKVLLADECSNKAFTWTLAVIQQLSLVQQYQQQFMPALKEQAKETAVKLANNLVQLKELIGSDSDLLDSPVLVVFSQPSSQQAKLLRVLKTIDFINTKVAVAQGELATIYKELDLKQVFVLLSDCLQVIGLKTELANVATVLLPLIESFMVVSTPLKDQFFNKFVEDHKPLLNSMVRNNPSLMSGSFSLLVNCPKLLEFDNKRTYFNQQLHKQKKSTYNSITLNVRRQYVFEDSYHQLQGRSGQDIKLSKLNVKFNNEEGVDAGGVTREWYSVLSRQMFNPDYALFKPSAADKVTYQPNRSSWINPDHLFYFKFVGRIIGKAIYDGRLLDAYFTRSFYKCMLNIPVDWKDMEAVDPEFHKSLEWIMNNSIENVLELTFSCEVDEFGTKKIVDLIPNGHEIVVTDENKHEYVKLITEQKLTVAISQQIEAFLGGFHEIIPADLISIFDEQELELLISGVPDIDVDDMKNNTEYQNYTLSSPQIQWFWRAVRSFTQEQRAKLIQFVTGTSKVPLEGFAHLQGSGGRQKFQIHKDFGSKSRLPSAHTCFNQLDLPEYDSYEQLRTSLLLSISECSTGFGFA